MFPRPIFHVERESAIYFCVRWKLIKLRAKNDIFSEISLRLPKEVFMDDGRVEDGRRAVPGI